MAKISGTLYRRGTKARLPYATVKLWDGEGATKLVHTDDDGDFAIDKLKAGSWKLVAFQEASRPSQVYKYDLADGDAVFEEINLFRLSGTPDIAAGTRFFNRLLWSFGLLLIIYLLTHFLLPQGRAAAGSTMIWESGNFRFLEILFWALAGVLINKLILSGWYLRANRFYQEGIVMHVSHLVGTPLMVLVVVVILSLAQFDITLANESAISIDLSDPTVLIAVSFLLGTSPWPLWRFVEDSAKRITGQTPEAVEN